MSKMSKGRLEAFSDGVIAIIITIMVLEIKAPHGVQVESLQPMIPDLLSYLMSFIYLGIYWNNHHHLFQAVEYVNGRVLWANSHLLFWLSLIPFVTRWMGENNFAAVPVAFYGLVLLLSAIAYYILVHTLMHSHGEHSLLANAIGSDKKGKISLLLYSSGVVLTFYNPLISCGIYALVALIWLVPDLRIEKVINTAD